MGKKRIHCFSVSLYGLAGMLMLYATWAVIHSREYISTAIAQNQLTVKGNEYDIVRFYMSNSAQYALFAVVLVTLGWMVKNLSGTVVQRDGERKTGSPGETNNDQLDEDELDDLFQKADEKSKL